MKKLYTFFCFFLPLFLWSQSYVPLLDNYNEWQFSTCFDGSCLTDIYYTNGDTIVENQNYKILDGFHYISRTFLLREDITEKRVYFTLVNPSRVDTYLLYDFSLEVGDTFEMKNPITPFAADGGLYVLDAIVPQLIYENELRNHFYFSPHPSNTSSTNTAIWVEGVGSLSLINAPGGFPDQNGVGLLNCFFKDGVLYYSNLNEQIPNCIAGLGHADFEQEEIIACFPNKNGFLQVSNTATIQMITIYDILGREIIVSNNHTFENKVIIDLNSFSKGIYIIQLLYNNGKRQSLKISY